MKHLLPVLSLNENHLRRRKLVLLIVYIFRVFIFDLYLVYILQTCVLSKIVFLHRFTVTNLIYLEEKSNCPFVVTERVAGYDLLEKLGPD